MRTNRDILKEFSRKTGITDPVIDQYFEALEETSIERIERYAKESGITDPVVDYFAKKMIGNFDIDWVVVDEAVPIDTTRQPSWWNFSGGGLRYGRTARARLIPRGRAVMTGIRAWDDDEDKPKVTITAHDPKQQAVADVVGKMVENRIDDYIHFWRQGGFGICEPSRRNHRNYVDGEWREAPKKLPESTSQTSENSEDHEDQE